jgi:hypothetical protein
MSFAFGETFGVVLLPTVVGALTQNPRFSRSRDWPCQLTWVFRNSFPPKKGAFRSDPPEFLPWDSAHCPLTSISILGPSYEFCTCSPGKLHLVTCLCRTLPSFLAYSRAPWTQMCTWTNRYRLTGLLTPRRCCAGLVGHPVARLWGLPYWNPYQKLLESSLNKEGQALVAHICNPNYSGGGD